MVLYELAVTNAENFRQYKNRSSLIAEQILAYSSLLEKMTSKCLSKFQINFMKIFYLNRKLSFRKVDPFCRKMS